MISIDPMSLNVGDTIYRVSKSHSWEKKIYFTDQEGIVWYRYPKDRVTYSIDKLTLLGRIIPMLEGVFPDEYKDETFTYVETLFSTNDTLFETFTNELEDCFITLTDAETHLKNERRQYEDT